MKSGKQPRNRTKHRRKLYMSIGIWNVLSWHIPGTARHAIEKLEKSKIDITAIEEVSWDKSGIHGLLKCQPKKKK